MTQNQKSACLDLAKHAIGMDDKRPNTVQGQKVYVPYRNRFVTSEPDEMWDLMVRDGLAEAYTTGNSIRYEMTPNGIQWMVKELRLCICLTY